MRRIILIFLSIIPFLINAQNNFNVDSVLRLIEKSEYDSIVINANIELGDYYLQKNKDTALYYFQNGLEISKETDLRLSEALCLKKIGILNYYIGNYKTALKFYSESYLIYKDLNNLQGESTVLNNIGIVYGRQGEYEKTLEYLLKSLKIDIEIGDKLNIAVTYGNIAILYDIIGQDDKSLEYLNQSLDILKEIGNKSHMPACYSSIGSIYSERGLYVDALKAFNKGALIAKEINAIGYPTFYVNIGLIHQKMGDTVKALDYFIKAMDYYKVSGNKNGLAIVYETLALLYIDKEEYIKSIEYATNGLEIAKKISTLPIQSNAYRNLSNAYVKLNNYEKAYSNHVLYKSLTDSIFSNNMADQISEMKARFETQSAERENEVLRMENDIHTLKNEKTVNTRNLFIAISGLGLLLVIFLSYLYRTKQSANKILSEKNTLISNQKDQLGESLFNVNELNAVLKIQKTEIEDHKNNLEKTVSERTSELMEKIDQLENYHKLFISREFRIKELRDELKDLKQNPDE